MVAVPEAEDLAYPIVAVTNPKIIISFVRVIILVLCNRLLLTCELKDRGSCLSSIDIVCENAFHENGTADKSEAFKGVYWRDNSVR